MEAEHKCKHELILTEFRYAYSSKEKNRQVKKNIYQCKKCNKYFFANSKNNYLLETRFNNNNGWYAAGVWQEEEFKFSSELKLKKIMKNKIDKHSQ